MKAIDNNATKNMFKYIRIYKVYAKTMKLFYLLLQIKMDLLTIV